MMCINLGNYGQAPAPLNIWAMILNGNMHQRAPVGSASTIRKTMMHKQMNTRTPMPMKMGNMFVFLTGVLGGVYEAGGGGGE